jgi:xanthine dehydrogenase accessory factor
MKEIFQRISEWQAAGEDIALVTLARVSGSAPRMPGARLALTRSGLMVGSVSGGCVEGDVFERALQVLDTGSPQYVEYGIADEMGFEVGLSCGGTINVLIERYEHDSVMQALEHAVTRESPAVLALAVAPDQLAGRRMLIAEDGSVTGAVDASLDAAIAEKARGYVRQDSARLETFGEASIFLETFAPPARLLIVGATHVGMALAEMADQLGFKVTVIDARSLFATSERFPSAEVIREWPDRALESLGIDEYTYIAVLTHDPKFDLPALEMALRSPARYIGAMGSRKTQEGKRQQLRGRGFSDDDLARIHGPIGLDIGAATPQEVAVSILGEIVAVRRGKQP